MKKLRYLIIDFKMWWEKRNARCAYCGWYLHPGIRFKNIQTPMKMTYCQTKSGHFVCSNCAHNPNSDY